MVEQDITHHIEKYIIGVLYRQKVARFRDLRKPQTETNLFSYHLKLLIARGIVKKVDGGYSLDQKGLAYVDRVSEANMNVRTQPKIVTMLVVQNEEGDVLVWRREKQPYIDTWTLPYGKLHIDDASIEAAALREAEEKLNLRGVLVKHAGDCYIRVRVNGEILSSTLAHVFRLDTDDIEPSDRLQWIQPHKLGTLDLAPAVEPIVARTFFRDPYFFEEFEVDW